MTKKNNTGKSAAEMKAINEQFGAPADIPQDQLRETDVFERFPTVNAGMPGFEKGQTIFGNYLTTKRCYGNTFNNPRTDERGREYRDLHILEGLKVNPETGKRPKIGIWSNGTLGGVLPRLEPGTFVGIRYLGQKETALKKGQNPPHEFRFIGKGGEISVNWKKEPVIEMEAAEDVHSDMPPMEDDVE